MTLVKKTPEAVVLRAQLKKKREYVGICTARRMHLTVSSFVSLFFRQFSYNNYSLMIEVMSFSVFFFFFFCVCLFLSSNLINEKRFLVSRRSMAKRRLTRYQEHEEDERPSTSASASPSSEDDDVHDQDTNVHQHTNAKKKQHQPSPPTDSQLETIRLSRQRIENMLAQPFFDRTVVGALVRLKISTPNANGDVYRLATILSVVDGDTKYAVGTAETSKQLLLDFGEIELLHPISMVSNGDFEAHELVMWRQLYTAKGRRGRPLPSAAAVAEKSAELVRMQERQYSNDELREIVTKNMESAHTLTARQRLRVALGDKDQEDLVARPMKMERNSLGQVMVVERS